MALSSPRVLLIGGLYLLAWLGLDLASQRFLIARDVTVWNPSTALDLVVLLVLGLRAWPLLVLSRLGHQLLIVPQPLGPAALLVSLGLGTVGPVVTVWLLRGWHFDPRLSRLRDVGLLMGVPLALALVVSALHVLNLTVAGWLPEAQAVVYTLQHWAGVVTGVGLLAPPLLLWARHWPGIWVAPLPALAPRPPEAPLPVPPRGRRALETVGEVLLIGLALWAGYGGPRGTSLDSSYALFVPLLWSAVRYGFGRTALTVLVLNVGVALLTGGDQVRRSGGLALQFGLLTVTLAGLLLGAVMRERQHLTARLTYLALHDPLTGLGNRRLFQERVARALGRVRSGGAAPTTLAVVLIDFDNFKAINDSLGHSAGDEVLAEAGARLRAAARPGDTLTRLGGDEFAVVLEHLRGADEAADLAAGLLRALAPPIPLRGLSLEVGASAGLALGEDGTSDAETLLRDADVALYHAKAHRRGRVQLFDAAMRRQMLDRLELEADLRAAVARGAFEVHYQPLVELPGGHLRGFEALIRWPHPTRGMLGPDAFVPLAEELGLVVALDRWVLRAATREVSRWPVPAGHSPPHLGLNLSAAHLHSREVVGEVRAALDAAGMEPSRLTLELTEHVLMSDTAAATATLRALRDLGVRLALDDFGTGYSSLSYLREFPISDLKVDRSFIADLGRSETGTELVRIIAVLGQTLGLTTVAEGIETPRQWAQVQALGYTLAQGYLVSPPQPAAQARELVGRPGPLLTLPQLEADAE